MRRRLHTALTWLTLAVAVIPASSPYWGQGLVPRTNDLAPHLYRALALTRVWDWNNLWPRWSPDLVQGFGYPVFNFFPALSHMAVAGLARLGLPLTTAYRATIFLHFWLAAAGIYVFGLAVLSASPSRARQVAAWLGALGYVYSPYILYDAHIRGSLPESQALAILPWLAWAWLEAIRGRRRGVLALPLALAAMFLSHYPVTYQTLWLMGLGWVAVCLWRGRQAVWGPLVGLSLGVLLTAFFWWPTLAEIGYTRSDISISQGYRLVDNFLTWRELIAWPTLPADPALINPPVVRPLPLALLIVGGAGLLVSWRRWPAARRALALLALSLIALCAWLITPGSIWVWEHVPLLAQTLYPWRLLGVIGLLAAGLVIIATESLLARYPRLVAPALTALFITAAIPWLFLPHEPVPENPGLADLLTFEAPPDFIGTTTLGEFLPRTVAQLPDTTVLRDALLQNGRADRLVGCELATTGCTAVNPLAAAYQFDLLEARTFTYRQFAFPGWRVTLDGAPLAWQAGQPDGLIQFSLPPGQHNLTISWGNTGPRRWGSAVSLGTLLFLMPITVLTWRRFAPPAAARSASRPAPVWLLLALALWAVGVWGVWGAVDSPLRCPRLTDQGILGAPLMTPIDYAGELRLWAVAMPPSLTRAADPLPVAMYWQALRPIGVPYVFGVQIVDAAGVVWSTPDNARPRDWRFVGNDPWPLTGYRLESFNLSLLDGAPPGEYRVDVGVVRGDTGQTIAVHTVGQFEVVAPAQGDHPLETGLLPLPSLPTADGLRLLGVRPDRHEARPGDPARLALLWQVVGPTTNRFDLALVDATGQAVWSLERTVADFPAAEWQSGDRLRSETVLHLPATLATGDYTWQVAWGGRPPMSLAGLYVTAPVRLFTPPAAMTPVSADTLSSAATLLGVRWESADAQTTRLTLVWRAENLTPVSYRVFVHVLDAAGAIIAQSDAEPAGWSRPTTGWLPGEIVLDSHSLGLGLDKLAAYRVVVGLYDPLTGQRLTNAAGRDSLTIPLP